MQLFQHKKALLLGAVLAAFSINLAFAEEATTKPTMVERVQGILQPEEEAATTYCYHHRQGCEERRGCEEYRNCRQYGHKSHYSEAELAKFRAARQEHIQEAMKALTPAQRREVKEFIAKDRAQRHSRHNALQAMTQEQREAVRAHYYGHRHHGYQHGGYGCYNR